MGTELIPNLMIAMSLSLSLCRNSPIDNNNTLFLATSLSLCGNRTLIIIVSLLDMLLRFFFTRKRIQFKSCNCRIAGWLPEEVLETLVSKRQKESEKVEEFGKNIKFSQPVPEAHGRFTFCFNGSQVIS